VENEQGYMKLGIVEVLFTFILLLGIVGVTIRGVNPKRFLNLKPESTFYLLNNNTWLKSMSSNDGRVPEDNLQHFSKLSAENNWRVKRQAPSGELIPPDAVLSVFASFEPARIVSSVMSAGLCAGCFTALSDV
jgi:hypothetical protein